MDGESSDGGRGWGRYWVGTVSRVSRGLGGTGTGYNEKTRGEGVVGVRG